LKLAKWEWPARVCFKWGVAPPARQPGEGTAAAEDGESGMKAAWDFGIEEEAAACKSLEGPL
jgi:hypothetical protein